MTLLSAEQEALWALQLLWCFREEKISCPCCETNPGSSSPQPSHYADYATCSIIHWHKVKYQIQATKVKGMNNTVLPVHNIKAYGGSWGITPLIRNLSTRNFTPQLVTVACTEGRVGHRASLKVFEKKEISWPFQKSSPRSSSQRPSHYMNYVILVSVAKNKR